MYVYRNICICIMNKILDQINCSNVQLTISILQLLSIYTHTHTHVYIYIYILLLTQKTVM